MEETAAQKQREGWPEPIKNEMGRIRRERQRPSEPSEPPSPMTPEQAYIAAQTSVESLKHELASLPGRISLYSSDAEKIAALRHRETRIIEALLPDAELVVASKDTERLASLLAVASDAVAHTSLNLEQADKQLKAAEQRRDTAQREHTFVRNNVTELKSQLRLAEAKRADLIAVLEKRSARNTPPALYL